MIIVGVGHLSSLRPSAAVRQMPSASSEAPSKVAEEDAAALSEMTVMCER